MVPSLRQWTYNHTTLEHLGKAHLDGVSTDANFSISVWHDVRIFCWSMMKLCFKFFEVSGDFDFNGSCALARFCRFHVGSSYLTQCPFSSFFSHLLGRATDMDRASFTRRYHNCTTVVKSGSFDLAWKRRVLFAWLSARSSFLFKTCIGLHKIPWLNQDLARKRTGLFAVLFAWLSACSSHVLRRASKIPLGCRIRDIVRSWSAI